MPEPVKNQETANSPEGSIDIDHMLDVFEEALQRLEASVPEWDPEAGSFPSWYNDLMRTTFDRPEVEDLIKVGTLGEEATFRYIHLRIKEFALIGQIPKYRQYGTAIQTLGHGLGEDRLGEIVALEPHDGELHQLILDDLAKASVSESVGSEDRQIFVHLDVLKSAYGLKTKTELLGLRGGDFETAVRALLLNENAMAKLALHEMGNSEGYTEALAVNRQWLAKALQAATTIDVEEADKYVYAAAGRLGEKAPIIDIIDRFDRLGVDDIRKISQFANIFAVGNYSVDQLKRMKRLADGSSEEVDRLNTHDVTAVFTNRAGDPGGVLRDVASNVEDDHERTVFFEANSMSDVYRYLIKLKNLNINPSTLLIATHSAPGQLVFSDHRDPSVKKGDYAVTAARRMVEHVKNNSPTEGEFLYSLNGMQGFKRVVDEIMKPSRAIDDVDADKGRKKIIFNACSAAVETPVPDVDENGVKFQVGIESAVSQIAKDLISEGTNSKVDIYGAADKIQMHRTEAGMGYTSGISPDGNSRLALHATRIRIENGASSKEELPEIVLRK